MGYALVMPIRGMNQVRAEGLLDQMTCLMDHLEDRQEEEDNFKFIEEKIARPLIDLGVKITAEQVQWCVGLMRTNGCEIRGTGVDEGEEPLDDLELGKVRALFPTMASMSHSCFANVRMLHRPGYRMLFRTIRKVAAGEELTLPYLAPFAKGLRARQQDIRRNWFFTCCCERCLSPTDLGWHSDSWICRGCNGGVAIPVVGNNNNNGGFALPVVGNNNNKIPHEASDKKVADENSVNNNDNNFIFENNNIRNCENNLPVADIEQNPPNSLCESNNNEIGVMCLDCSWSEKLSEVEKVEGGLEEQLELLPLDNNEEARLMGEELLSNCEATRLHPHHRILMAAKRKIALSPAENGKQLSRKVEFCDEVVEMLVVLQPGLSDMQGLVLYERASAKGLILQKEMEAGLLSPTQFVADMGKVLQDLEMTVTCLGVEMPGTYKRMIADKADAAAVTLKELCSYAEFL